MDTQLLNQIRNRFELLQEDFNIYNDLGYEKEYRFEKYDQCQDHIEKLAELGVFYSIYDEDDETSYIRPDCYNEKYNQEFQERVERLLQIRFEED